MKKMLTTLMVPIGVVGIIMLLVVPVPPFLLDVLIILNIMFALVILLTSMFVKKPLDFSVFPSLLLVATLFRLGLNVASTRLVLGEAYAGRSSRRSGPSRSAARSSSARSCSSSSWSSSSSSSRRVPSAWPRSAPGSRSTRCPASRWPSTPISTRDSSPTRRPGSAAPRVAEADFYGAMDGASKFVKGDAIAGLVIIIINIVGGIAIGLVQHGMSIDQAMSTYSLLTIGDGLVTQIPALLMAVSTGMIVTRSTAETEMGTAASAQLGSPATRC